MPSPVRRGNEIENYAVSARAHAEGRALGSWAQNGRLAARPADASRSRSREFAEVYAQNVRQVYGFVGYRVATREEAEDLTQQTFERALRAWARFDPARASALTWLLSIARNLLIDHYRAAPPSPAHLDDAEHPVEQAVSEKELGISPELERALAMLSDRDRELIALRFGGDLTGPEIAKLTGLSLANVQQILSRALRRLRSLLEQPATVAP